MMMEKIKGYDEFLSQQDMLEGNLVRMCISTNQKEIDKNYNYVKQRIELLYEYVSERAEIIKKLNGEKKNGED